MIVTCPSCSSSYKVNESKIKGRGAKITCPRCRQRFVVYRDQQGASIPPDIATHDFRTLGIVWRVRKGMGVTYSFHDLQGLKEAIHDGQVNHWDQITFDNRNFESIKDHDPLDAYFWEVWQKAKRGDVTIFPPEDEDDELDDEDESDAPTTIVGRGSQLASQISQAVSDAATPAPADPRHEGFEGVGHLVMDHEDDEDQRTVQHADEGGVAEEAVPEPEPVEEPSAAAEDTPGEAPAAVDEAPPAVVPSEKPEEAPPAPAPAPPVQDDAGGGMSVGLILAVVLMVAVLGAAALWGAGIFGTTPSVEKPAPSSTEASPKPPRRPRAKPKRTEAPAVAPSSTEARPSVEEGSDKKGGAAVSADGTAAPAAEPTPAPAEPAPTEPTPAPAEPAPAEPAPAEPAPAPAPSPEPTGPAPAAPEPASDAPAPSGGG